MKGDWYAARVETGRERAMEMALRSRGFEAMMLVRRIWARRSRRAKARELVERSLLPGYLFVRMGPGGDWRGLCAMRGVFGIVGVGGVVRPVPEAEIKALRELGATGAFTAPAHHRDMAAGREVNPKDRVEILGGAFDGAVVVVEEIFVRPAGTFARVPVNIFGRETVTEIGVENLALVG